jgi:PAS domain S-box-containing protein
LSVTEPLRDLFGSPGGAGPQAELYRALFEHTPEIRWVADPCRAAPLAANAAALRFYGYDRDAFLRLTAADLCHPDDRPRFLAGALAADGPPATAGVCRHRRRGGEPVEVVWRSHDVTVAGRTVRVIAVSELSCGTAAVAPTAADPTPAGVPALNELLDLLSVIALRSEMALAAGEARPLALPHILEIRRAVERAALWGRHLLGPAPPARLPAAGPTGSTVLLAEDNATVRALLARALRGEGYQVLEADDGPTALQLAEQHTGPIDLLLADLVMPGLPGEELADRLRAGRPGLRLCFISSAPAASERARALLRAGHPFLQKPFPIRQLLDTITGLLRS